jgi:hypothetical protein
LGRGLLAGPGQPIGVTPGRFKERSRRAERLRQDWLNARYRRPMRARGHFPNGQPALQCLYLVASHSIRNPPAA